MQFSSIFVIIGNLLFVIINLNIVHSLESDYDRSQEDLHLTDFSKFSLKSDENDDSLLQLHIFLKVESRSAISDPTRLWNNGVVPYKLSEKLNSKQKSLIQEAIDKFKEKTCIQFLPQINETQFLVIGLGKGCSATLGEGPAQNDDKLNLGKGCFKIGIILHEMMHVLGFIHEHNRPDRDKFIKINEKNIQKDKKSQFKKASFDEVQSLNVSYDYGSLMHYVGNAFAIDRKEPTIIPLKKGVTIGQREKFSEIDLIKINKLYNCSTNGSDFSLRQNSEYDEYFSEALSSRGRFLQTADVFQQLLLLWDHFRISEEEFNENFQLISSEISATTEFGYAASTAANEKYKLPREISNAGKNFVTSSSKIAQLSASPIITVYQHEIGKRSLNLEEDRNLVDKFIFSRGAHEINYHQIRIIMSVDFRTVLRDPSKVWTDGIVPFVLSNKYNSEQKQLILEAMEEFHKKTCIQFCHRFNEQFYIFIEPEDRCASTVGLQLKNPNRVLISEDCYLKGIIIHELMHILGFVHEQNRPDRDKFVKIKWENIIPRFRKDFRKLNWSQVQDFDQGYDYESIMHYDAYEFAENESKPTIVPLKPGVIIGQRDGFSRKDLIKINRLYQCFIE